MYNKNAKYTLSSIRKFYKIKMVILIISHEIQNYLKYFPSNLQIVLWKNKGFAKYLKNNHIF